MVRYNALWPKAEEVEKTRGAFMISLNQYSNLKSLMANGPVRVHGKIDATLGPGKLTHVHAYIRGSEHPEQEVLITAHLDHPKWSANDNASGAASLIEMARTLNALIATKKIPPPLRTIHFMWVSEYYGTLAYASTHKETRRCGDWDDPRGVPKWDGKQPCTVADINMDMVGEDTQKTNGRFYFTRTPDSVPSFLNALLEDVMQQTRDARLFAGGAGTHNYWQPESIPLVPGSDHEIFLGLGIPSTMFGHEPDWTHHTSEDTVDKTDASELLRVGAMATAASEWMANTGYLDAAGKLLAESDTLLRSQRVASAIDNSAINGRAKRSNLGVFSRAAGDLQLYAENDLKGIRGGVGAGSGGGCADCSTPHRLALLPINSKDLFADLAGDDKQWWEAQDERFASPEGDLLPLGATRDKLVWETINFMDGHRSTAEIADLLSAEYLVDIDQAWVDRLMRILEAKKLAALK